MPATSITIKARPRKAKTYVAFVQNKAVVFATAFMLLSNFLAAQNCADFDIKFLQTNVMACNEEAVFYLEEASVAPPPTISSIDVHTWAGFTFSSYNYDPGMGTLTFYGVAITAYKQFGTFTATVHHAGGHCEISGKVVACCNEGLVSALIVVDEDISDQSTATTLTGDVIFMGDVTFAANSYLFNATRVFLGPDAQLLPQVNADFTFRDANLQPFCDCRWDRILLADASNVLSMDETTMRGALRGINATTAVATSLTASNFLDNFVSLYIENSTGTGPYNNSYFKVDGCTFDLLNDPTNVYCYDDQKSTVNMASIAATTCQGYFVTDVIVNGASDNVHVGHENYTTNKFKNTFNADKKHISFNDSQGYVRNNQFANGYFYGLSDALIFVGGTVAQMNVFSGVLTEFTVSAAILQNNSYTNGSVKFTDPINTPPVASGSPNGCEMAFNDFSGTAITVDGDNSTNVRFRIFDNYMYNSPPTIREMPGSGSNKVIFHSNYLENNTTAALAIIDQCNFITFANNHIEQLTFYTPADLATYNGVWWSDTRDATVSNNYLENCARGFSISGDNTTNVAGAGTQFTCNEFVNCFHAFYLSNPTLLNQGSSTSATDNCYNYFYSGSFPYGEQIAGPFSGSLSWFMRTPTSCNSGAQPFASCYCTKVISTITTITLATGTANTCTTPASTKTTTVEVSSEKQLLLLNYPNPVATELTIKFETPTDFAIYNLQGQQVFAQKAEYQTVVDVRQWPDGTYIIRTATQNGKFVVRK